jgi:hypothetical protein
VLAVSIIRAASIIAMMMQTAITSETSVNVYQTTGRNNPEDSRLHTRRRENLKSHSVVVVCLAVCPNVSSSKLLTRFRLNLVLGVYSKTVVLCTPYFPNYSFLMLLDSFDVMFISCRHRSVLVKQIALYGAYGTAQ